MANTKKQKQQKQPWVPGTVILSRYPSQYWRVVKVTENFVTIETSEFRDGAHILKQVRRKINHDDGSICPGARYASESPSNAWAFREYDGPARRFADEWGESDVGMQEVTLSLLGTPQHGRGLINNVFRLQYRGQALVKQPVRVALLTQKGANKPMVGFDHELPQVLDRVQRGAKVRAVVLFHQEDGKVEHLARAEHNTVNRKWLYSRIAEWAQMGFGSGS